MTTVACVAAVFSTKAEADKPQSLIEADTVSAGIMSSIQLLRVLVNERLSAAAEEIFEAVKKTVLGYEEEILLSKREIHRQRRMLRTVLHPEVKINKLSGL